MEKKHIEFVIEEVNTLSAMKLSEIIKPKFELEVDRATISKILRQSRYINRKAKIIV